MLTDEQIKEIIGTKAQNVVITGDENSKDIGIKVGLFAQSGAINASQDIETQERSVKGLLRDLILMNKRYERDVLKAKKESLR